MSKAGRFLFTLLLFLQCALIITGGAVRLTGSGLGCPTWPECTPGSYTPTPQQVEGPLHAWIEFGNRLLTFALFFAALATIAYVLRLRRRELFLLSLFQLLGILGQGVLGGITVLTDLNPYAVASHFILSIFLIAGAALLRAGIKSLRKSRINGEPRAMMCGIGQCFDCVVTIDGKPLQRACITPAREGANVGIDESSRS